MNKPINLALFDLDHTLLPLDSDYHWADFLARSGHVGDPETALRRNDELMQRYNEGNLSAHESFGFMLGLIAHRPLSELQQWQEEYMEKIILPAITDQARDLLKKHQKAGDLCAIVTATNDFVTTPIAQAFNITHLIATIAEREGDQFTGQVDGIASYQEGKITRVDAWLEDLGYQRDDFKRIWFYSDSINDLPLMEVVSDPVATNPCPQLRAHAQQNDWQIIDLFAAG
ncbi:MAG TPA: HAD family hydrolase [Paenalcaligenes sp.]|nr:HAD family hydrolase [Paenalcaligenes sp.]